jgi:glycosyltransferase involved in cell wall biosynthesis
VETWFLEDVLKAPVRWRRFEALWFAKEVTQQIRQEPGKFDVVNLHAPWGCIYGRWRRRNGETGNPPYVLTMQGSEERYVEMMKIEQRKGRAWNFNWKNRIWHRLYHQKMYDESIKTADYGAVANREAWICAELKYKREPGRFWYVPNGTEERFFIAREFPQKAANKLLFVGTWLDRKGVYYLAEAFALAARKNEALRLTIAGCSVTEAEVKKMFAAEVSDRVAALPFIKREEMVQVYAAHDVFVFPSLVEGMPLTLLEAMATGMPVVTTNTSGMADVVEDDVNGLLVPAADAESLAAGIARLCESADLRQRLGLAGQETIRRYTWARIAERMEKVYELAAAKYAMQGRVS